MFWRQHTEAEIAHPVSQVFMRNPVIRVENVSRTYGKLCAVNDLSFCVREARCFGLLGPNGAGKTTMMKMLYGKAQRDDDGKGAISIFGYDPHHHELEIKYITGIVPQEDNLDSELSVENNLLIYSRFYGMPQAIALTRIEQLLQFMELTEKKKARIRHLSGGMKRRLTIARALLNNPRLLILDEPTTGLDPQVRHLIWDKIRNLKKEGVTVLLTTHYMEEAFQLCDTLAIMDKGATVLEGRPMQLVGENIEPYVLEVFHSGKITKQKIDGKVRMEQATGRTLFYSQSTKALEKIAAEFSLGDVYLRQSNLEDLFLKITGRGLNE